jgi:hypothetical protein
MVDNSAGEDVPMEPGSPTLTLVQQPVPHRLSPRPGPEEAGPSHSTGKRKRSDNEPESSSSQSKKQRTTLAKRAKKLKKPSDWHMKKGEVPKDAEKTKVRSCINSFLSTSLQSFS